jgi:hypothetical protein
MHVCTCQASPPQAELHCLQRQHTSLLSEADVLERQVSNLKELLARVEGAQVPQEQGVLQPRDTNVQVGSGD